MLPQVSCRVKVATAGVRGAEVYHPGIRVLLSRSRKHCDQLTRKTTCRYRQPCA
jgi:hypothetical protein